MVGFVTALTLQLRDDRRAARQAQLTAARLEVELLKKNIQPHFLLNTLATIQEVIEQEPKTAMALVDALASEFRILNRMSGEKLVELGHELELCRAHLHVMSLRKGAGCTLNVVGVDERALMPPALFLTLIENGLTHLLPRDGKLEFTLRAEYRGAVARYAFVAEGVRQPNAALALAAEFPREAVTAASQTKEGTGLRYIKARLEESFTGAWALTAGPVPEGWETIIEIGTASALGAVASGAPLKSASLPTEKPA
jgi:LytS/YehU family sensor histidine kinase